MSETILFLDLETTGLDPKKDLILEAAMIAVDFKTLEATRRFPSWLLKCRTVPTWIMPPKVRQMHEESGLLEKLDEESKSDTPYVSLQGWALWQLSSLYRPGELRVAGYSPHFDLGFIREQAPHLCSFLHHQIIDVSTLRATLASWGLWDKGKPVPKHRALDDCNDALEELKAMRDKLQFLNGKATVAPADRCQHSCNPGFCRVDACRNSGDLWKI